MRKQQLAREFDTREMPVEAAWAYEVALQDPGADLGLHLDLTALYFAFNDTGFFSAHHLPAPLVDAAYGRAMEVLDLARHRFGAHPEIDAWRLHLRDRVIGEEVPDSVYESLAEEGSTLARLLLYLASERRRYAREVEVLFAAETSPETERGRYFRSFAPLPK